MHNASVALLAEKIRLYFENGIRTGPGVRHYIASTLSHPTAGEFRDVLNDPGNCERETLLELLFFPDLEVQIALEKIIAAGRFQKGAEDEILRHLMQPPPVAAVCYPDPETPVRVVVPEDTARQFLARLRIRSRLPASLLAVIEHNLPEEAVLRARVMIRNARFSCRGAKAAFLEAFFRHLAPRLKTPFDHLTFVLHFLETAPPAKSLKDTLAECKQQYRKILFKAGQIEKLRAKRNVETLIMQGVRLPLCDPEDAMQKITLIDALFLAIYGETP